MAASCSKSDATDKLGGNVFTTTIDPEKDKISVCSNFLKRWGHKLNFNKHGYITNGDTGQKTLIKWKNENGELYLSPGTSLSIMNGIKEPTQFELHYEYYQNYFLMYRPSGDDEMSTESDRVAEELLQEISKSATDYDSVNNQREQGIEEGKAQQPKCGDNEVDHYTWKQICSRRFAAGESVLHFPSKVCNKYPFTQNQMIEVINLENNDTMLCPVKKSETSNPQYHLTKPWYKFIKNMHLKENDEVSFLLDYPPTKLFVLKC